MDLQRTEDNHREHEVETWTSRGQRTITGSMKWRHGPPEDRGHIQGTSSEDMDLQKTEDTHRELQQQRLAGLYRAGLPGHCLPR